MDPDLLLDIIRNAARVLTDDNLAHAREESEGTMEDTLSPELREGYVDELVEHTQALDDWLSRGGFLPGEWSRN